MESIAFFKCDLCCWSSSHNKYCNTQKFSPNTIYVGLALYLCNTMIFSLFFYTLDFTKYLIHEAVILMSWECSNWRHYLQIIFFFYSDRNANCFASKALLVGSVSEQGILFFFCWEKIACYHFIHSENKLDYRKVARASGNRKKETTINKTKNQRKR